MSWGGVDRDFTPPTREDVRRYFRPRIVRLSFSRKDGKIYFKESKDGSFFVNSSNPFEEDWIMTEYAKKYGMLEELSLEIAEAIEREKEAGRKELSKETLYFIDTGDDAFSYNYGPVSIEKEVRPVSPDAVLIDGVWKVEVGADFVPTFEAYDGPFEEHTGIYWALLKFVSPERADIVEKKLLEVME